MCAVSQLSSLLILSYCNPFTFLLELSASSVAAELREPNGTISPEYQVLSTTPLVISFDRSLVTFTLNVQPKRTAHLKRIVYLQLHIRAKPSQLLPTPIESSLTDFLCIATPCIVVYGQERHLVMPATTAPFALCVSTQINSREKGMSEHERQLYLTLR